MDPRMTSIRPWREVAIPHSDVLKGTFSNGEHPSRLWIN